MNDNRSSIIIGVCLIVGLTIHALITSFFSGHDNGSGKINGVTMLDNGQVIVTANGTMWVKRDSFPSQEGPWKKIE